MRRSARSASRRASALAFLLLGGCASRGAPPEPAQPVAPVEPPPSWVFHPRTQDAVTARRALGDAELLVDEGGGRWLLQAASPPEPAAEGAPEGLVDFVEDATGVAFIGRSGAVYLASQPLEAFREIRRPPSPLRRTVLEGRRLFGSDAAGRAFRSDDLGLRWQSVALPGYVAELLPAGQEGLLAVTLPERWWRSRDAGGTFEPLDGLGVAPRAVVRDARGAVIEGVLGPVVLRGGAFAPAPPRPAKAKPLDLPRYAAASPVERGVAALDRGYVALEREGERWRLWSGSLTRPLASRASLGLEACAAVRLAAYGDELAVLCAARGKARQLQLLRSVDGGARFESEPAALVGELADARLALGPGGVVALYGVCPAASAEAGCEAEGVHVAWRGEAHRAVGAVGLDRIFALRFAQPSVTREALLLALGQSEKGGAVLLESFTLDARSRAIERSKESEPEPHGERRTHAAPVTRRERLDLTRLANLPSAEDGTTGRLLGGAGAPGLVTAVLSIGGEQLSVVVDAAGRLLASGRAPKEVTALDGFGLGLTGVAAARGELWESVDGGITWASAVLPRRPCAGASGECTVPLACSEVGCLVGDELTRVGRARRSVGPAVRPAGNSLPSLEGRPGLELHCRPRGATWQRLLGVAGLPSADDAALGDVDFAQVGADFDTGEVSALHARGATIQRTLLLAPVAEPERFALGVSPQIEGSAAVRYRIPDPLRGEGPTVDVDFAWDNRIEGIVGRGRLAGTFAPAEGDSRETGQRMRYAEPALLSVAEAGLYARLHADVSARQPTYFVDQAVAREVSETAWPSELARGEPEMVRVGDADVALQRVEGRRIVARSEVGGGLSLRLLAPLDARAYGLAVSLGLAYIGRQPALLSVLVSSEPEARSAYLLPLAPEGGFGPPVAAPLQSELAVPPRACSATERASGARVVAPSHPGPVHRLVLEFSASEEVLFMTGRAVLFAGSFGSCVGAWEADVAPGVAGEPRASVGPGPPSTLRVLVLPRPGAVDGWLLRTVGEPEGGDVEAQPLDCSL